MTLAANLAALARRVVGLSANNLVALDANGKLPPVAGDRLTNVTGVKKRVSSGLLTPSGGGLLTWGHGLGAQPSRCWATAVCQVAEYGYAVGDEIEVTGKSAPSTNYSCGVVVISTSSTVTARVGTYALDVVLNAATAGPNQTLTTMNWKVKLWAEL